MVELVSCPPLENLLPVSIGSLTLRENDERNITAILPFNGKEQALLSALEKAHDLRLPAACRLTQKSGLRLIWSGRDHYLLLGAKPASRTLARGASLVDQSDGWAIMRLEGVGVAEVMSRLCPVDLRVGYFKRNHVVTTEFAHMAAIITRIPKGVEIMVGRSFAATAVTRLSDAMESITAQQELTDIASG